MRGPHRARPRRRADRRRGRRHRRGADPAPPQPSAGEGPREPRAAPLRRLPIESTRPIVVFAWSRLGLTLAVDRAGRGPRLSLLGAPGGVLVGRGRALEPRATCVLAQRAPGAGGEPAGGGRRHPDARSRSRLVAPETYGAVRFMALAFLAVHAHFQGERLGLAVAAFACAGLVGPSAITGGGQVQGDCSSSTRAIFAAAALATAALVGRVSHGGVAPPACARASSPGGPCAREGEIRRQISESLHDGPVQEMVGLDMALAAARAEAEREGAHANEPTCSTRRAQITERNVTQPARRDDRPGPVRLRGDDLRRRRRALPARLAAPLRPRHEPAHRPRRAALADRGRPVPHHPGGGDERRQARLAPTT